MKSITRNQLGSLFFIMVMMVIISGTLDFDSIFQFLNDGYILIYGIFLKTLSTSPSAGL